MHHSVFFCSPFNQVDVLAATHEKPCTAACVMPIFSKRHEASRPAASASRLIKNDTARIYLEGSAPILRTPDLRPIMGQEGCHGSTTEIYSRVQT